MDPRNEQAPADAEPQSTSEILEQAYDELAAEDEEVVDGQEVEETAETEEADAGEEEATEEAPDDSDPEVPDEPLAAEAEEAPQFDEPPPERWPAEMKEAYQQLPPQAKQVMLEQVFKPMQRQYTQSTQELAQMRQALDPMLQSMQQHGPELQKMGLDAPEAFRRQMAWAAHFAQVGPEKGLQDMAASYGLNQPGQQGQDTPTEEYMTPVERAMKARMDQMEQHLSQQAVGQQQAQQQQVQQANQAREQSIRTELQTFVSETKDGKPAHPHVEKVGHAMAGLIRGGLVEKFDEYGQSIPVAQQINQAYSLACQMDPRIKSVSPRAAQGQVNQAKRANASAVGNTTAGAADVGQNPIAQDIADLYDQLDRRTG